MSDAEQIVALEERVARLEKVVIQLAGRQHIPFDLGGGSDGGSDEINLGILGALEIGRKVEAVHLYRKLTNCGLKEAKNYVDDLEKRMKRGEL